MPSTLYSFIDNLEDNAQKFLSQHLKPITIPVGNLLFYQGDVCTDILLLTKGEVRLFTQADGIEEITLYTLRPGEQCIVNTASLISQTQAVASAETVTDIEGYLIDAQSIKHLTKISDVYQNYLFSLYTLRFEALTKLINSVKFKQLDQRILEWVNEQSLNPVPITHEALANELGTSRVVVSRVLKRLEHQGLVVLHRGKIERCKEIDIRC